MNEKPEFFDLEIRYALLSDGGDPLERLKWDPVDPRTCKLILRAAGERGSSFVEESVGECLKRGSPGLDEGHLTDHARYRSTINVIGHGNVQ